MSANKRKGTAWETAICRYLNGILEYSHPSDWRLVRRHVQTGAKDQGDIWAWPFILEAKDVKSPAVPTWLRQADTEADNAGFPYGVVVHKLRGKGPALARVHISECMFSRLLLSSDAEFISPLPNPRTYWTWTLAEFAEVLCAIRSDNPPRTT